VDVPEHIRAASPCASIAIRAALSGRWFAPGPERGRFVVRRFHATLQSADPDARNQFYSAMEARYRACATPASRRRLVPPPDRGRTRGARHQRCVARRGSTPTWSPATRGFDDTFDLFTGARALAENLDLDRALRGMKDEEATIDVASIQGVDDALRWIGRRSSRT
jgi:hypothetical protein